MIETEHIIESLRRTSNNLMLTEEAKYSAAHAAEALALVAWAEEKKAGIDYLCGTWYCGVGDEDAFSGPTLIGCIAKAKEAYEKEK